MRLCTGRRRNFLARQTRLGLLKSGRPEAGADTPMQSESRDRRQLLRPMDRSGKFKLKEFVRYEKIKWNFDGDRLPGLSGQGLPTGQATDAARPQGLSRGLQAMFRQGAGQEAPVTRPRQTAQKIAEAALHFSAAASRQWLT